MSSPRLIPRFDRYPGEKPYVCGLCGEAFSQLQGYNAHKRAHDYADASQLPLKTAVVEPKKETADSVNITNDKQVDNEDAAEAKKRNDPLSLTCRFCGRGCKTLRTLVNHENIHINGISKNSYKYFMEVKEKEFKGEKLHACEVCNEKFGYKNSLSYHKRKSHRLFSW